MTNEIEKKWVVPTQGLDLDSIANPADEKTIITQGYLDTSKIKITDALFIGDEKIDISDDTLVNLKSFDLESSEVRYRIKNNDHAVMTFKSKGGLVRAEEEFDIPLETAEKLKARELGRVDKARFKAFDEKSGCYRETDIYGAAMNFPFVSIEIEFPTKKQADAYRLNIPRAIDVTENRAFKNKNLAIAPQKARDEFAKIQADQIRIQKEIADKRQHL